MGGHVAAPLAPGSGQEVTTGARKFQECRFQAALSWPAHLPSERPPPREPLWPLCCLRCSSQANHPNHSSTCSNLQRGHNSEQRKTPALLELPLQWERDQSPNFKNK